MLETALSSSTEVQGAQFQGRVYIRQGERELDTRGRRGVRGDQGKGEGYQYTISQRRTSQSQHGSQWYISLRRIRSKCGAKKTMLSTGYRNIRTLLLADCLRLLLPLPFHRQPPPSTPTRCRSSPRRHCCMRRSRRPAGFQRFPSPPCPTYRYPWPSLHAHKSRARIRCEDSSGG